MKNVSIVFVLPIVTIIAACNSAPNSTTTADKKDSLATTINSSTNSTSVNTKDFSRVDSSKETSSAKMDKSSSALTEKVNKVGIKKIKVLYGTDRRLIRLKNNKINYSSESIDLDPHYKVGYTIVSIPPSHLPGRIERPSIWKLQFKENPKRDMVQESIVRLSDNDFDDLLKNIASGNDAFIFVHGYNNSFRDAALRTAQLAEDINLHIIPIMFSWSSNAKATDYIGDGESVHAALPAFKNFLKRVSVKGNFKKIHLIAHSMGNRLISQALVELEKDTTNFKIDQIIMAAPDVYAEEFRRDIAPIISNTARRITVYSAKNDWALATSNKLSKHMRLGQVGRPPFVVDKIDIIDAVNVKTDFLGHGRWAESEVIINDITKLLINGIDPASRGVPHDIIQNKPYFYFKKWRRS